MLTVQFDQIKSKGLLLEGTIPPDRFPQLQELGEKGELLFPEPLSYRLDVSRIADIAEIDGRIEGVVELACGRCLEPYRMPFSSRFALAFTRQLPVFSEEDGVEVELSADELGLILFAGDEFSLVEPLQEQVLMALPIQPLCRKSCKGLCGHCGANLNDADCCCEEPVFDTRFAALKGFKAGIDNKD